MTNFNTGKFKFDDFHVDGSFFVYKKYSLQGNNLFLQNGFFHFDEYNVGSKYDFDMLSRLLSPDYIKGHPPYRISEGNIKRIEDNQDLDDENIIRYLIADAPFSNEEDSLKVFEQHKESRVKLDLNKYRNNFYTELAKLNDDNFDDIFNFINTWGLLTGLSSQKLPSVYEDNDINIFIMPIDDFLSKIDEYKKIFEFFKSLILDDFSNLNRPNVPPDFAFDIKLHAITSLETELMYKNNFNFRLIKGKEGGLTPTILFEDMFEFAYFYFLRAVYDNKEMRTCENCGHLFEVRHQRQRFCAPLPFRKRSSCEMAYNNNRKKNK